MLEQGGMGARKWVAVVTKSGKTFVEIGGYKFRVDTGAHVGGDVWHGVDLHQWTPGLQKEIEDAVRHVKLESLLFSTKWRKLPLETLEAVAALLELPQGGGER